MHFEMRVYNKIMAYQAIVSPPKEVKMPVALYAFRYTIFSANWLSLNMFNFALYVLCLLFFIRLVPAAFRNPPRCA